MSKLVENNCWCGVPNEHNRLVRLVSSTSGALSEVFASHRWVDKFVRISIGDVYDIRRGEDCPPGIVFAYPRRDLPLVGQLKNVRTVEGHNKNNNVYQSS